MTQAMTKPAFYSARTWFAPPTRDQITPLLAAGCPAPWLEQELFSPRDADHHAWIGQVCAQPVAALVGSCEGDALHIQGWLAPSLRGLGLATEALDALASELLVRRSLPVRPGLTRIVLPATTPAVARMAERCGAVQGDGEWVLDRVGHTGLDRSPALTGERIARLIASLRPADGAALEPVARAHAQPVRNTVP